MTMAELQLLLIRWLGAMIFTASVAAAIGLLAGTV